MRPAYLSRFDKALSLSLPALSECRVWRFSVAFMQVLYSGLHLAKSSCPKTNVLPRSACTALLLVGKTEKTD